MRRRGKESDSLPDLSTWQPIDEIGTYILDWIYINMAHTGIFATAAECASKAGENVDITGWVEANINQWCSEAESYINVLCKYNFSDNYATLNADVKKILTEATSNLVGVYGILYNMAGYTSRVEAEDMINVLWARFNQCIRLLQDMGSVDYMNGA